MPLAPRLSGAPVGSFQAFVVSPSMIAPTLAMAFNEILAAKAAGRATPLSFLAGGGIMALVGLSFFGGKQASFVGNRPLI